jgi:hypothetical protein
MVEFDETNNPVARLYLLLEAAHGMDTNWGIGQVWAKVLDIPRKDQSSLLLRLAELVLLADQARLIVEQLDDVNRDSYLPAFDNIRNLVTATNLDQQWGGIRDKWLDPVTIHNLKLAATSASAQADALGMRSEKLQELQSRVEDLQNEVLDTTFPAEFKTALTENLEQMRATIISYRISGLRGDLSSR